MQPHLAARCTNSISSPTLSTTNTYAQRGRDDDLASKCTLDHFICEVSYSLKLGGRVVASGTLPDPGWIAAAGDTKLEIPARVPYDFLISVVKDVGRDWDVDYVLEVGLTVDLPVVGNFTIPLSVAGEFKLPTLKDMFA